MSSGSLFQPAQSQAFASLWALPSGGGRARPDLGLKTFGAAARTAWSLGIEWYDYARQAQELTVSAGGRLAAARDPGAALAVQATYWREAGALAAARMPAILDLSLALLTDLTRMPVPVPVRPGARA